jgi:hypothetical protein
MDFQIYVELDEPISIQNILSFIKSIVQHLCVFLSKLFKYIGLDNYQKIWWWVGSSNEFDNRITVVRCNMKPTIIQQSAICRNKSVDNTISKLISRGISEIITLMLRTRVMISDIPLLYVC